MPVSLRRLAPRFFFVGVCITLGFLAGRFDSLTGHMPSTSVAEPASLQASTPPDAPQRQPLKIGAGKLSDPQGLSIGADGELVVLDGGNTPTLRRFAGDGQERSTYPLPAELSGKNMPDLLAVGAGDGVYLARTRTPGVWKLTGRNSAKISTAINPVSLAARGGVLFVLGQDRDGIERIEGTQSRRIALSGFPEKGTLSHLRVRGNGDFYAYAYEEGLVWRFDANGKLIEKIGGGGARPPEENLPAEHLGHYYDVAENGDVYWTLGDYGALLKIDAKARIATHFRGRENGGSSWTGTIGSLTGFVLANDYGYVLDRGMKRITALPTSWVEPGATNTLQVDTRAFGLSFKLKSDAPYKVFVSPQVKLRAAFEGGNRTLSRVRLELKARDFAGNVVATQRSTPVLDGNAPAKIDLPVFNLPRLGWYQIEAAIFAGDTPTSRPLVERVHFITRTVADPALPIPDGEYSGWEDLRTHRMVGMGLHRFALHNFDHIERVKKEIQEARTAKIPFIVLIINKKDCTPEKLKVVLDELKSYGEDAPLLELINEPDLQMSAREYVEILRSCRDAIKNINPRARILGPVQCGVELGWFKAFFGAGGGELIDAVSIHTYERHNSMDAYHWQWKFQKVQEVLKQYHCDQKPLYQTEHGFLGDYGGLFSRPQWQANQLTLEKLVLDRFGIDDEKYFYYYVNESGYRDYNAYIVNRSHELFPAAAMTRIRRHLLGEKKFARALDFAAPGDWLLTANLYQGAREDLIILQNNGTLKPVEVQAQLPAGARILDCWGNALPASGKIPVGRTPTYITFARGANFQLKLAQFGRNIAAQAKIRVDDAKGQSSVARLTNGQLEFDFLNRPEQIGFLATDGKLPLDLTLEWSTPQTINGAILYASLADNDKSTPLEYELLARQNGAWRKVAEIQESPSDQAFNSGETPRLTNYENPWIFQHLFEHAPKTIVADALRFRFKRTTYGHFPNAAFVRDIGTQIGQKHAPRVELREVQVFSR